jgi:DNA-binding CsgD family transcriptional regulator
MAISAVARLEPLGESPALARALSTLTGHELVSGRYEDCIATCHRAIAMAERFELEDAVIYGLDSLGSACGSIGRTEEGVAALREALDRGKRADLPEAVARASGNLAFTLMGDVQPALALEVLDDGIATAEEHELRFQLNCLRPSRAEVLGLLGEWDAATAELANVLNDPWASPINRAIVGMYQGRIRARRGDPHAIEALDEALETVLPYDEAQMIAPTYLARAEAKCLAGERAAAAADVEACLAYLPYLDTVVLRELSLMARRAGVDWLPDDRSDEVVGYIATRDHRALHRYWADRGCRYEAADALADSEDPGDLRQALDELTELGARPRANQVARRLRELGVREVPRGPRASTRSNAAGLTTRELQVASLLAEGLTNAEIAERLVVSQKTVDHHASAVLTKLAVSSRRHVARAAAELGLDLSATAPSAGS